MSTRLDAVVWAARRAPLKEIEAALSLGGRWRPHRESAIITPLFHASPKYRHTTPSAMRLRVITLENGDYQQIHNPGDNNFDQIFEEWPRAIINYALIPQNPPGGKPHQALLECHDLHTNWEKAGWTTGTTIAFDGDRKDRHKIVFGLFPWDWPDRFSLEGALKSGAEALARLLGGQWSVAEGTAGISPEVEAYLKVARDKTPVEEDPLDYMRSLETPDVGRM